VKGKVCRWAEARKWKNISFVGAHPMVGSHERGLQAANPRLYDNGIIFLVRPKRIACKEAYGKMKRFWSAFSRNIVELKAGEHDRIVGEISHLPHAVSACLMLAVSKKSALFSGAGFRDTTRIAASHPSVWVPIFMANRREVLSGIRRLEAQLRGFCRTLKASDASRLGEMLQRACVRRRKL